MSLQLVSGHHDYIHTSGMEEFQWMRRTEKKNSKVEPAETLMFLLKILILLQKHFKSEAQIINGQGSPLLKNGPYIWALPV